MYEYLSGVLVEKSPARIVLDSSGIGFDIRIPVSTFSKLPALGEKTKVLIHYHVREDAQILYGFISEEDRELFRQLISVSGIGPKSAITVLSGISARELKQAIIQGNLDVLTAISGIGKKTAERILVELREKIVLDDSSISRTDGFKAGDALMEDSLQALVELGYKKPGAKAALEKALKELGGKPTAAELIRKSLKYV